MAVDETNFQKIKRSQFATFLNVGKADTPDYARFGKGIAEQDIDYGPEKETNQWIHEDNPNTDLENYAPSFDTEQKTYLNEPIFEYVYEKMRKRAVGTNAITDYLKVYMFKKLADGVYEAEKCNCTLAVTNFSGSSISYSINENGDPISGYVTVGTDGKITFTGGEYQEQAEG